MLRKPVILLPLLPPSTGTPVPRRPHVDPRVTPAADSRSRLLAASTGRLSASVSAPHISSRGGRGRTTTFASCCHAHRRHGPLPLPHLIAAHSRAAGSSAAVVVVRSADGVVGGAVGVASNVVRSPDGVVGVGGPVASPPSDLSTCCLGLWGLRLLRNPPVLRDDPSISLDDVGLLIKSSGLSRSGVLGK